MLWNDVRRLREGLGLNQKEFAKRLGISAVHASKIERPPSEGGAVPSEDLLRRIAGAASGDGGEERKKLERKLIYERTKLVSSDEVREILEEKTEGWHDFIREAGMPSPFLRRLEQDLKKHKGFTFESATGEDALRLVLKGDYWLSREDVIKLARQLGQPVDEYLMLANYLTEELMRMASSEKGARFLRLLTGLGEEEFDDMIEMFGFLLDKGYRVRLRKEKGEGG